MTLSNIIGIGGHAMLLSAIALRLACIIDVRRDLSYVIAIAVLLAVSTPIGSIPIAQVTRGIFGDMSITTLILMSYFFIFPTTSRDKSKQLFILVVITGLLFYPTALGLGMTDPYQWGYLNSYRGIGSPMLFLGALIVVILIAARLKNDLILLCIAMATGAFVFGAMESKNIWDYLIDPMIVTFGLFRIGIDLTKQLIGQYRA
jgi:hypothetical protein